MAFTNAGPSQEVTINSVPVRGTLATVQTIAVSMTPAGTLTITCAEQTFSGLGTGILPGDVLLAVNPPSTTAGLAQAQFRVDTAVADKFYVAWVNPTAGTLTAPSGNYLLTVGRFMQTVSVTPGTFSTLPSVITSN